MNNEVIFHADISGGMKLLLFFCSCHMWISIDYDVIYEHLILSSLASQTNNYCCCSYWGLCYGFRKFRSKEYESMGIKSFLIVRVSSISEISISFLLLLWIYWRFANFDLSKISKVKFFFKLIRSHSQDDVYEIYHWNFLENELLSHPFNPFLR